jgi:hypothetical protein
MQEHFVLKVMLCGALDSAFDAIFHCAKKYTASQAE